MSDKLTDFSQHPLSKILNRSFPVSGAVDFSLAKDQYLEHFSIFEAWIRSNAHANMSYLSRGLERRQNPELVFSELKSVIAVLRPYPNVSIGEQVRYARYLNGVDYHETLKNDLVSSMEDYQRSKTDFKYKVCVDTSAVLERTWASLCGLGWIGKNTLLIHPQLGSYTFIGIVFTNEEFGLSPKILNDYCGTCSRCITGCPTQALRPHFLESKKCISYLTLEHRGIWEKSESLSGFVAGCDLCQEVCPFNHKPVKYEKNNSIAAHLVTDLQKLKQETEVQYKNRIQGTALDRISYSDFKRNLTQFEPLE
jgi:epoxyqueuosine reductase